MRQHVTTCEVCERTAPTRSHPCRFANACACWRGVPCITPDRHTDEPRKGSHPMTTDTTCPACKQDNDPSGPGCDCYGDPEPHYPSTAELAAFRATFPLARYIVHPTALPPYSDPRGRPTSGAWADECRDGIGYRYQPDHHALPALFGWGAQDGTDARREASALRSRAYLRQPCGSVAAVLTLSDIAPVTCRRHADHTGSHCAHLPGAWQWWNRDGSRRDVEIPMAAYIRGGRPSDYIDPE